MTDSQMPPNAERNLLDEIEELNVLEAEELQEGVAFHAFRFHETNPMQSLELIFPLREKAELFVKDLSLPQGATLITVEENRMRFLYDPTEISGEKLQASLDKSLGKKVKATEFKLGKEKLGITSLKG